jgi:glycerol uptake facilitator-like aquaporin
VRYRRLDAWAEREQRRFDEQRANPRVPGTEPTALRALQAFLGTFVMATRFLVLLPLCIVWVIALIAQHTASSLVSAVVVVMLGSIFAFTTGVMIRARRERGANWFTGLAPKVRSN